jgi:hypothetical protein
MKRRVALAGAPLALLPQAAAADISFSGASFSGGGGPLVVATAGSVTLTGIVPETIMASLRIPANSIGKNGAVEVTTLWAYTNSANNKTMNARFAATAGITGTIMGNIVVTTNASSQGLWIMRNANATNVQNSYVTSMMVPYGATTVATFYTTAVDTTADSYVNLTGTVAAAAETLTLQHAYAVILQAN